MTKLESLMVVHTHTHTHTHTQRGKEEVESVGM